MISASTTSSAAVMSVHLRYEFHREVAPVGAAVRDLHVGVLEFGGEVGGGGVVRAEFLAAVAAVPGDALAEVEGAVGEAAEDFDPERVGCRGFGRPGRHHVGPAHGVASGRRRRCSSMN